MFTKIISLFLGLVISFFSSMGLQISDRAIALDKDKLNKNITESTEKRIADGDLTGAHIIVNQNNVRIFDGKYGKKSVTGADIDGTEMYRIASMTKPVTAVALLIAQEQGLVDINKNVYEYLPEFKDMYICKGFDENGAMLRDENNNGIQGEKATNPIKVFELVSHTSGIGEVYLTGDELQNCTCKTAAEYLATQPLYFNPGTSSTYSTGAFDVAAYIIEKQSGMEFSQFCKKYIFDPLGMVDTTYEPTAEQWSRFVAIHGKDSNGNAYDSATKEGCVFGSFPATYHAAGAALASTTEDYSKFAQMLLNEGKAADGTVVMSAKSVELMRTPVDTENNDGSVAWGLAVRVITDNSNRLPKGSFGWSGAYGSHFWVDPVNKITAVYMKNSLLGGAGCATANEFEKDVYDSYSRNLLEEFTF